MAIVITPEIQSLMNQINTGMANLQQGFSEYKAQQGSAPAPAPVQQSLPPSSGGAYINQQTQQSYPIGTASPGYNAQGQPVSGGSSTQLNVNTSIVDYLKSTGQPSDFASRANLAKQYGIPNYTGTADQNIQLLSAVKSGSVPIGGTTPQSLNIPPAGTGTTTTKVESPPPPKDFDPYALYQQELTRLQNELSKKQTPTLTPEEEALYQQMTSQVEDVYTQAMADLVKQQEQEKQRLIGRFAAMGFSEPGIVSGEVGAPPGVVTKALQELGTTQQADVARMQSQRAQGLTAIEQAKAETLRRMQEQAENTYQNQMQTLMNALQNLMQPNIYSAGGMLYNYNPATGEVEALTPSPSAGKEAYSTPQVADDGTVYVIDYSSGVPQMITIGKVAKTAKENTDYEIKFVPDPLLGEYGGYRAYRVNKKTGEVQEIAMTPASTPAGTAKTSTSSKSAETTTSGGLGNFLRTILGINPLLPYTFNAAPTTPIIGSPDYSNELYRVLE